MGAFQNAVPDGPKGLKCPLQDKDCGDACRTCVLWRSYAVQKADGTTGNEWDCMLAWQARFNLMNNFRLDGIQKGVEQQRNLLYAAAARRLEAEQSKMIEGKSDDREPERE